MKKLSFAIIFCLLTISIFGQLPNVVVYDFSSRARDINNEDIITLTELIIDALDARQVVNVIAKNILERNLTSMDFNSSDWSNNQRTTQLGQALNADYLVNGTLTQLGTSITFTINVRDIKTLVVISSVQKQYNLSDIWDNTTGIPGQLSEIINSISSGINNEHSKRQQEIKTRLAQEEAERRKIAEQEEAERKRIEEDRRLGQFLIGSWWNGQSSPPETPDSYKCHDRGSYEISFNVNGTFSARLEYWRNPNTDRLTGTRCVNTYNGTYTRNGNTIMLSYNGNANEVEFPGGYDRNRNYNRRYSSGPLSGGSSHTISISSDGNRLTLSAGGTFADSYRRR